MSWQTNRNRPCGCSPAHCAGNLPDEIIVVTPLVVDFSYAAICDEPGQAIQHIVFTDQTTGGIEPYTYSWNFGEGATPLTSTSRGPIEVSYSTPGTKIVTLTVIDSNGNTDSQTLTVEVDWGMQLIIVLFNQLHIRM